MSNLPFSFFKQGNQTYEVVDKVAREATSSADKKYIFIFDSYGGRGLSDYAEAAAPNRCHVLNVGGAGFTGNTSAGLLGWPAALEEYLQSITAAERATYTDVMVFGGINDYGQTITAIKAAMGNFKTVIDTYIPQVTVTVCPCSYSVRGDYSMSHYADNVVTGYSQGCLECGFKFRNGLNAYIHSQDLMVANDVHPNADGIASMGTALQSFIEMGEVTPLYSDIDVITLTPVGSGSTVSQNNYLDSGIEGDHVFIRGRIIINSFSPAITIPSTGVTNAAVGTLSHSKVFSSVSKSRAYGSVTVPCYFSINSGASYIYRECVVQFVNGQLVIQIEGGNLADVTGMQTDYFYLSLPLDRS